MRGWRERGEGRGGENVRSIEGRREGRKEGSAGTDVGEEFIHSFDGGGAIERRILDSDRGVDRS